MKIVETVFGSHLYGTDTENSDKDYKGIYLPTLKECVLSKIPKSFNTTTGDNNSKNNTDDVDREIYSLQHFVKLACEGQTVAIDMLHTPDDLIIEKSWIWDLLVENREKFYTKNLKAFIGYARKQASKYGVKGSRLDTVKEVLEYLKPFDFDERMKVVWDNLPQTEHTDFSIEQEIDMYHVCGRQYQATAKIGYVYENLDILFNSYGKRAILAKENKCIDWKACSHALRSAYQVKELLEDGTITFPLKDADFLTKVKLGQVDYITEFAPEFEKYMSECEELTKVSTLPEKVDRNYWDEFIFQVYMTNMYYNGRVDIEEAFKMNLNKRNKNK